MPLNPIIARTHRLILRRLNPGYRDALCGILCHPEVMRYSMGFLRPDEVVAWLIVIMPAQAKRTPILSVRTVCPDRLFWYDPRLGRDAQVGG